MAKEPRNGSAKLAVGGMQPGRLAACVDAAALLPLPHSMFGCTMHVYAMGVLLRRARPLFALRAHHLPAAGALGAHVCMASSVRAWVGNLTGLDSTCALASACLLDERNLICLASPKHQSVGWRVRRQQTTWIRSINRATRTQATLHFCERGGLDGKVPCHVRWQGR